MVRKYSELYLEARKALRPVAGEQATILARELLAHAAGIRVETLLADLDRYCSDETDRRMAENVQRALREEPLAYILGKWSFYGLELTVSPDVLIPRDDTMAVTDLALEALQEMTPPQRVLDLCTGSGCIGLAVASRLPEARVTLADLSPQALKIAKTNIQELHMSGRVNAFSADALQPLPKFFGEFDVIVSNPPYVTGGEMGLLQPSVRDYEPQLALYGGEDGLDFYRAMARTCIPALKEGGALCLEFGMGQEKAVSELLESAGFCDLTLREDSRGVLRAVRAIKK